MRKQLINKTTYLVLILLVLQLAAPIVDTVASANGDLLPPSNLAAQYVTPDDVKLTWSSVFGATGYNIYEIQEGQLILHGKTTSTSYSLNNLAEGSYRYVVSTLSSQGESGPSAPVSVDIIYPQMAAPTNLTYTLQNGNDIVLNWGASQYAESYNIYQIGDDNQKTLVSSVTTRTFRLNNVLEGQFTYAVSAINSLYGESPLSTPVQVEVVYPTMTAPSNFTFTLSNGSDVTLKWNSVPFAKDYKIYQIIDGQKVLKNTVAGTSTTVKFTNVPAGEYTYVIHSNSDRFGESEEGSQLSVTVSDITMAAPSNLTYKIQNVNDIVLNWNSVPYATSYKVYQMIDGQKTLKSTVTTNTVSYTKMPTGEYSFVVHSFSDRYGESAEGSQVTLNIQSESMSAPSNLTYQIQNGNDIVLSWGSVSNATSYKVYQLVNGQKTLKSTITSTTVRYNNQPAGDYSYVVHSFSDRFGESVEGSQLSLSLVHPTMEPPTNVVQTIQKATEFTLSWDASDYATSYKVYQIVNGQKSLKSTVSSTNVKYTNMAPGEYSYIIHSVSSRFGESSNGTQITVTLNGQTMEAPSTLTYSISNGNDITLNWSSVEYATSYKVYQVIDGQKVLKSTVTATTVKYPNQPDGEYKYVVYSFSNLLGESPEGAEISFSLVHPTMAAPGNLTYKVQNGNDVVLNWGTVQYANNYKVYELVDGQKVLKSTVTSLSATIAKVSAGEHTYVVHSVSTRFGESPEGTQITLTINEHTMAAPGNLTYSISAGNDITLRWNSVTYASSYKVYKIMNGQPVLERTVTSTSVQLTNVPEGDYTYVVHSYSERFGESPEGSQISVTIVFPIMQEPGNLSYSISNGNDITLRWNAASYATSYNIYEIVDGQKVLRRTVTGTATTFTNMPEGQYTYEVHSYSNRFGESPVASKLSFSLIWPIVQPPQVSGEVFNANNITLSWSAATWANEYRVYKVNGDSRELLYKGTARSFKVYNLTEDTHSFEVTAFSSRFGESASSNRVTEKIVYPIMQPPVASLILLSDTSARISWDFITYANGYNIYEIVEGKPVIVAEKVNNLSYTLTNLSYANHEYYVTSYSNSFGESAPSNIVLAKLIVDTEAPVTTANIPKEWINHSVTVTLSATDNETGVANTYYSINDSAFAEGTSFTIEAEGIHKVSFYSVDKVGNTEVTNTSHIKIDKTSPVTTSNIKEGWYKGATKVVLSSEDSLSGVNKTFYSINGSKFTEGSSFELTAEGVHKISFYSVDKAGNVEEAKRVEVKVDKTPPSVTWNLEEEYSLGSKLKLNYSASDKMSGIAHEEVRVNGELKAKGDIISFERPGQYTIEIIVKDHAGWTTKLQKTVVVYIPVEVEVLPKVINNHTGEFTVKVTLPTEFTNKTFDVESVRFDGQSPITSNNGQYKQAEKGQFKFNRSDFSFPLGESFIEFRAMVDGQLVIGYGKVVTKK